MNIDGSLNVIGNTWKKLRCPSTGKNINKECCIQYNGRLLCKKHMDYVWTINKCNNMDESQNIDIYIK